MNEAIRRALRRLEPHVSAPMRRLSYSASDFERAAESGNWSMIAEALENHVFQGGRGDGDWRFGVLLAQAGLALSARGLHEAAERAFFEASEVLRYIPVPAMSELLGALRGEDAPAPPPEEALVAPERALVGPATEPPPDPESPPEIDWMALLDADPEKGTLAAIEHMERYPSSNAGGEMDSVVQRGIEELKGREILSRRVCGHGVDALCRGGASGAYYLLGQYAGWAAERDPSFRRPLLLSFTQKSYDVFSGWRPDPPPAADFNDWQYQGWSVGEDDWPLAALAWKWIPEERLLQLLDQPVTAAPERSIQYLILRRLWTAQNASLPCLEAIARLIDCAGQDPRLAPLLERAMLVFDRQWRNLGIEWRKQEATRVWQVLEEIGRELNLGEDAGVDRLDAPPPEPPPPDPYAHLPPAARRRAHRLQALRQRTAYHPDDAGAWLELADLHEEAGDLDDAIAALSQAAARAPLFAVAHYRIGKIRMTRKQYREAQSDFSNAIVLFEESGGMERYLELEKPPDAYVDSYRTRGVARCHDGDYAGGLADVGSAIRLRRDDARLIWERGYLHEKASMRDEAVRDYLAAGILYVDAGNQARTAECASALDRLGAQNEAAGLRPSPGSLAPESDLP